VNKPIQRIAVVAPAGGFSGERLRVGMDRLRSWGLEPVEGRNLWARARYTAGTASQRADDLRWALCSDDVDAVWFVRGGFGTVQTLSDIPWGHVQRRPVIGFSDATALFSALVAHGVAQPVHGPVLQSLCDLNDAASVEAIRALLIGGAAVELPHDGAPFVGPSGLRAKVVGGNLCVLASLAGTPWALDARGCILLLEEVGEPAYKIDRLLTQLDLSGGLRGVLAVGIGELLDCKVPGADGELAASLMGRLLRARGFPVFTGLPFGHGPHNLCWLPGREGTLTVDRLVQGRLAGD
jgi:muramoyltetrapeptide carboxypeptidase